jgi:hypothetical protein
MPGRESRGRIKTPMKVKRLISRDRPARAAALVMALILAGCGGDTSAPAGKTGTTPAQDTASTAAVSEKSSPKASTKGLAPGGDMGVRERRSQKLKERAAAKQ